MADTTGTMISRAVGNMPKDDTAFRTWLQKTLNDHRQDIKTLFDTCTDTDMFEKLQRDNQA